jgi:hypothetical protein
LSAKRRKEAQFLAKVYFRKMLKSGTEVSIVDSEVSKFMKIESSFPADTASDFRNTSSTIQLPSSRDLTAFRRSKSHEFELAMTPDVRAEVVARGKALVADPNYPSKEQIKKIARVLAASRLGS